MKIAILGSTGMLGSAVLSYLRSTDHYEIASPTRYQHNAESVSVENLVYLLRGCDYAINCIGIIKPNIDEQDPASIFRAIMVNSIFPHHLAMAANLTKCHVLQIATDCVFSGHASGYDELSPHDSLDVYGKTKSLGEVKSPFVRHLRCSIIGPNGPKSLLDWFLNQSQGARVSGFTNHFWNGITTLAFAKICHGIMSAGIASDLPPTTHILPANWMTKAALLHHLRTAYERQDIHIVEQPAETRVDRTLSTTFRDENRELWQNA